MISPISSTYNNYYTYLYKTASTTKSGALGASNSLASILGGNSLLGVNSLGSINYSALNNLQSVKTSVKGLQTALNSLSTGAAFNQKTAVSSNPDAVSVTQTKSGNIPTFSVGVTQLASGQANTGSSLAAAANAAAGSYQVQINLNNKTHTVAFQVNAGDTNQVFQQKFADAINKKGIGLTASVQKDGANSTLSIRANTTGDIPAAAFTLADYTGNAVATLGVNNVSQAAQNAIYNINGQAKTSASNTVALTNGATATLKQITGDPVIISAGTDKTSAKRAVDDMVSNYNDLVKNSAAGSRLTRELTAITQLYAPVLGRLGITAASDGTLKTDETKLNAAAENGSLKAFFTQSRSLSYGFSGQLNRTLTNVSSNAQSYISALGTNSLSPNLFYNQLMQTSVSSDYTNLFLQMFI